MKSIIKGNLTDALSFAISRVPDKYLIFTSSLFRLVAARRMRGQSGGLVLRELAETLNKQAFLNDKIILVPAFSDDFVRKGYFDPSNSPSKSGALSRYLIDNRFDDNWQRTFHPIVSYLATGQCVRDLVLPFNNAFGSGSIFDILTEGGGVGHLCFDIAPERGFTLLHRVEEEVGVSYRFTKYFHGTYFLEDGPRHSTVRMFVRKDPTRRFGFPSGIFENPDLACGFYEMGLQFNIQYFGFSTFRPRIMKFLCNS